MKNEMGIKKNKIQRLLSRSSPVQLEMDFSDKTPHCYPISIFPLPFLMEYVKCFL